MGPWPSADETELEYGLPFGAHTGEIRPSTGRTLLNPNLGGFTFDGVDRGTGGNPGARRGGADAPRDGGDGVDDIANADENQDVGVGVAVELAGTGNGGG
ncbi:hypothetical protein PInf_023276 [Phytophthora infestans]|nr:hypothetical protein PInf_023276 [Phytophthora infestans]